MGGLECFDICPDTLRGRNEAVELSSERAVMKIRGVRRSLPFHGGVTICYDIKNCDAMTG
jgi:hypothetical protein